MSAIGSADIVGDSVAASTLAHELLDGDGKLAEDLDRDVARETAWKLKEAERADKEAKEVRRLAEEEKKAREKAEANEKKAKAEAHRADTARHAVGADRDDGGSRIVRRDRIAADGARERRRTRTARRGRGTTAAARHDQGGRG